MITQELVKEILDYNYKDGTFKWRIWRNGGPPAGTPAGSKGCTGYLSISIKGKLYLTHRLAWLYHYGYMPEGDLDHIDRVPLNNRIENLREVSDQCNLRNTGNFTHNTSGVKGVHKVSKTGKWAAALVNKQKGVHLGFYDDFDEAVLARLAGEQALNWSGCDSTSPAYKYAQENIL